jgi:2-polyprenyl-3-methyl-5-hydroxy-6-metoxy-1,4-benzoquinol methylase
MSRMPLIPWRVKNFLSDRFPLAYHLAVNIGFSKNSPEYWDASLAESWNRPTRFWPAKVAVIQEIVGPEESIVDVGCGNGSILRDLRGRGFTRLHGLEQSEYAVKRLSAEGIPMSRGTLLNMPFEKSQFDVAIASEVLEHVIRRNRFCKELSRIVRPSGRVLIFVPNNRLGPISEPEHVKVYNAHSLRAFLNRHWAVESISTIVESHNGADSLFAVCRNIRPM